MENEYWHSKCGKGCTLKQFCWDEGTNRLASFDREDKAGDMGGHKQGERSECHGS